MESIICEYLSAKTLICFMYHVDFETTNSFFNRKLQKQQLYYDEIANKYQMYLYDTTPEYWTWIFDKFHFSPDVCKIKLTSVMYQEHDDVVLQIIKNHFNFNILFIVESLSRIGDDKLLMKYTNLYLEHRIIEDRKLIKKCFLQMIRSEAITLLDWFCDVKNIKVNNSFLSTLIKEATKYNSLKMIKWASSRIDHFYEKEKIIKSFYSARDETIIFYLFYQIIVIDFKEELPEIERTLCFNTMITEVISINQVPMKLELIKPYITNNRSFTTRELIKENPKTVALKYLNVTPETFKYFVTISDFFFCNDTRKAVKYIDDCKLTDWLDVQLTLNMSEASSSIKYMLCKYDPHIPTIESYITKYRCDEIIFTNLLARIFINDKRYVTFEKTKLVIDIIIGVIKTVPHLTIKTNDYELIHWFLNKYKCIIDKERSLKALIQYNNIDLIHLIDKGMTYNLWNDVYKWSALNIANYYYDKELLNQHYHQDLLPFKFISNIEFCDWVLSHVDYPKKSLIQNIEVCHDENIKKYLTTLATTKYHLFIPQ